MSAVQRLEGYLADGSTFRLIDSQTGRFFSVSEFSEILAEYRTFLSTLPKDLLVLRFAPTVEAVAFYLASLFEGFPLVLVDPAGEKVLQNIIHAYQPLGVYSPGGPSSIDWTGFIQAPRLESFWLAENFSARAPIVSKTSLLLTTSGSTGSPKLVRLTLENVLANATSIAESLKLTSSEVAITSMPLFYSYGLSVLNSHIVTGATVVLSGASILEPAFWENMQRFSVTSFSGVPYTYQMLARLGSALMDKATSLKTLTQAGGKLPAPLIQHFHEWTRSRGKKFHVMYGQTEACARMSCLDPTCLPGKIASVGPAIPGGEFLVEEPDPATGVGEIIYRGPNVMLGYATSRSDMINDSDDLHGILKTGDLGYLDQDGFLHITGRTKRIAKVAGIRISLEEIEAWVTGVVCCAAVSKDDRIVVYVERPGMPLDSIKSEVVGKLGVHPSFVQVLDRGELPRTANGKVDYKALS